MFDVINEKQLRNFHHWKDISDSYSSFRSKYISKLSFVTDQSSTGVLNTKIS